MISAMQIKWSTKRILIGNIEQDAAYLRIHKNTTTTSTCIEILYEIAFLCLGLPFGTKPAPAEYTNFSEAEIDLVNDLFRDESWDTDELNSPH